MRLTLRVLGRREREPHGPADSTTGFFLLLMVVCAHSPPSGLVWEQLHPSERRGLGSPNESLPVTERRAD